MIGTLFLAVMAIASLNAFIDPLNIFASPRIPGINALKPRLEHHREYARYIAARRLCTGVGIFGNSRAEIGLDPEGPGFKAAGLSAFNHAIPGTDASTSYRQIRWLQAANCMPKTVIVGAEFFDFLGASPLKAEPLASDGAPSVDFRFIVETLFSITGLRDSITTLLTQHSRYPAIATARGLNPLLDYIPEVARGGHYNLFRQRGEENARNWSQKPLSIDPQGGGPSHNEAALEAILSSADKEGNRTYVIIYPYHAQIRIMMERLGMGRLFEQWKRRLVTVAERNSKHGKVEVWDFSAPTSQTMESIPVKGDRETRLAYY